MIHSSLLSKESAKIFNWVDFKGKVIIIGAGAAGLFAGFVLRLENIDFTILEASDRIGGRLGKIEGFADYPLDLGAQWLHGKKSFLGKFIKRTKTAITKDKSREFYWFKNKITKKLPRYFEDIWEEDEKTPDVSFQEYASQQGLGEEYRHIIQMLAAEYGADSKEISAYWTKKEEEHWSSGEKDYKFEQTFFDLIDQHFAAPIRDAIQLNVIVKKIDYAEERVKIIDQNGNEHLADKVIITVPIPILQDGDIEFSPPLPDRKIEAFQKIGMGPGMKVFLKFSRKFYKENVFGGKICASYADEIIGKKGKDHILMAFMMGKQAAHMTSLGNNQLIIEALLEELDLMYEGQASASFLDAHIVDFTQNPFIKGAYSFSKVGMGNARSIAAESVAGKLFFAGEAMNLNGHHQTVHGAIESAYREVLNIRDLIE
jgi:monoamine oxidase